jgi:hypothetical protein
MKTKKLSFKLFIIISFCQLIISCGGNSSQNGEKSNENENSEVIDCDCRDVFKTSEGIHKSTTDNTKGPFTGICESKNAQGERTELSEYKNGFLLNKKEWKEVDRKMIQIKDMKYYNEKNDEGFEMVLDDSPGSKFVYVYSYNEYKKGKNVINYRFFKFNGYGEQFYQYILEKNDSEEEDICKTEGYFIPFDPQNKEYEFLECVKNKNLPKFFYTKL